MADFITAYIKGCTICQATKPSTNKLKVPLYSIMSEKSAQPFFTITLDLIVDLPKSGSYDSILTITDHDISKATLFFPCNQTIGGMGVALIFVQHVFFFSTFWSAAEGNFRLGHPIYFGIHKGTLSVIGHQPKHQYSISSSDRQPIRENKSVAETVLACLL